MPKDNVSDCCDIIKSYIIESPFRDKIFELIKWIFSLSTETNQALPVKYFSNKSVPYKEGKWIGFFLKEKSDPFAKFEFIFKNNCINMDSGFLYIYIAKRSSPPFYFKKYSDNPDGWARITGNEFNILPNHKLQECIYDSYKLRLSELGIITTTKSGFFQRWCTNTLWVVNVVREPSNGEAVMTAQTLQATEATTPKIQYRVTNWPRYDRALVERGSLTIWFDEEFLQSHWQPAPTGKRGAPFRYSDEAIQALLGLKAVFDLPYRMVEGLAGSIVRFLGLALPIPDHSLMSRRAKTLRVQIPRRARTEPIHLVVDSTGLQVYGEGEWKVRQHGVGKRRTWRKVHLAVDAHVKDVVAVEVTTEQWTDGEVFAGLLEQIDEPITQIDADGAYDTREVYQAAADCGADLVVPPRANAAPWAADHPRTQALAAIAEQGLAAWKRATGYHHRSLAENAMYRFKQLFGDRLACRHLETQVTEVHSRVAALNVMTYLGMPVSVPCRVSLS